MWKHPYVVCMVGIWFVGQTFDCVVVIVFVCCSWFCMVHEFFHIAGIQFVWQAFDLYGRGHAWELDVNPEKFGDRSVGKVRACGAHA